MAELLWLNKSPRTFSKGGGASSEPLVLGAEWTKPNCTEGGKDIGLPSLLYRNVVYFRYIAAFRNEGATQVKGDWGRKSRQNFASFSLI